MLSLNNFWARLVIWVKYLLVFFRTLGLILSCLRTLIGLTLKWATKWLQIYMNLVLLPTNFDCQGHQDGLLMLLIGELISKNMYFSPIFRLNLEIVFSNPCKPWKMMWTFLSWIKFWFHLLLCNYIYQYSCN